MKNMVEQLELDIKVKSSLDTILAAKGDKDKMGEVIKSYMPMVCAKSNEFMRAGHGTAISLEDLIQSGIEGLIVAVDKFDPNRGNGNFTTFAKIMVTEYIKLYFRENIRQFSVSQTGSHRIWMINNAKKECEFKVGRKPTREEISDELLSSGNKYWTKDKNKSMEWVNEWGGFTEDDIFIDLDGYEVEDITEENFSNVLGAEEHTPFNQFAVIDDANEILEMVENLSDKEKQVIKCKFGIGGCDELTHKEIGAEMGITHQRVAQISREAMKKLRMRWVLRNT